MVKVFDGCFLDDSQGAKVYSGRQQNLRSPLGTHPEVYYFGLKFGYTMRKGVLCHTWTVQIKFSLHSSAVRPVSLHSLR